MYFSPGTNNPGKFPAKIYLSLTKAVRAGIASEARQSIPVPRMDCRIAGAPRHDGFSLVELSIVLVILGLLVGGILTGQNLIRSSELRSIASENDAYQAATNIFRDKYQAVPGDMVNATSFWGRADDGTFSGDCTDPANDVGTGTQTCNGNGDGWTRSGVERFRFWQHLANAGLISGSYNGIAGAGGLYHHVPGDNAPYAKLSGASWSTNAYVEGNVNGSSTPGSGWFAGNYGNWLLIGAPSSTSNPNNPVVTPEEVWNIDMKADDGKPGLGRVRARPWGLCTNAADETDVTTDYDLQNTAKECLIYFTHVY